MRGTCPGEPERAAKEAIAEKLDHPSDQLDGRSYLMGDAFAAADAYLSAVLSWTR